MMAREYQRITGDGQLTHNPARDSRKLSKHLWKFYECSGQVVGFEVVIPLSSIPNNQLPLFRAPRLSLSSLPLWVTWMTSTMRASSCTSYITRKSSTRSRRRPLNSPLSALPSKGCSASRSMASIIRARSALATRSNSLAALRLIRIEKFTLYLIPIEHWIVWIAQPINGHREIIEFFEITLDRLTDYFRSATLKPARCLVQRVDYRIWQTCGDLCHRTSNAI